MNKFISSDAVIGVDLGGTNIRAGLVVEGQVANLYQQLVPESETIEPVIDAIVAAIREVFTPEVKAIGVGVPGLVEQETGVVFDIQNIAAWERVKLKEILEREFGVQVAIDNDANCFVLSELYYGQAKNRTNVIGLALGTGMGAGIVSNGKLHSGSDCGAGELGAIPYLDMDYEAYCSGAFFKHQYQEPGEVLFDKAWAGDEEARKAFEKLGEHLGNAVLMIAYAFAPDLVVVGGSIAKSKGLYTQTMMDTMYKNRKLGNLPEIKFSDLSNSALLGAAALCFDKLHMQAPVAL